MRSHHVVATLALVAIGFSIKVFFFPSPVAQARLQSEGAQIQAEAGSYLRELQTTIDVGALPVQNILSEADPDPNGGAQPNQVPR